MANQSVTTTISLAEYHNKLVKEVGEKFGITRSEVIRRAIEDYHKKHCEE